MSRISSFARLLLKIRRGDISMLCIVFGLGLIVWATLGFVLYPGDLWDYSHMYRIGSIWYWAINHWVTGSLTIYIAASGFPVRLSQAVGAWMTAAWGWSAFLRATEVVTLQTGAAVAGMYVVLGVLILHRSAFKERRHVS